MLVCQKALPKSTRLPKSTNSMLDDVFHKIFKQKLLNTHTRSSYLQKIKKWHFCRKFKFLCIKFI